MRIVNSIFGFILTVLLVLFVVYFTVPSFKDKVDGLFTPPAIEQPSDTETEEEEVETPSGAYDNVNEEHTYN